MGRQEKRREEQKKGRIEDALFSSAGTLLPNGLGLLPFGWETKFIHDKRPPKAQIQRRSSNAIKIDGISDERIPCHGTTA